MSHDTVCPLLQPLASVLSLLSNGDQVSGALLLVCALRMCGICLFAKGGLSPCCV